MTPHNEASRGDYAEAVLLPGDPERAEWIAETFLEAPRRVNAVRGELGFTGSYRGMPVSVQATGIGAPSLMIYVHELVATYGVKTLVRVGTCGALEAGVGLRSLVIAQSAAMDSAVDDGDGWRSPDEKLFALATGLAAQGDADHHVGPMVSSDTFYHPDPLGRFAPARALAPWPATWRRPRCFRGRGAGGQGAVDLHRRRQPGDAGRDRQVGTAGRVRADGQAGARNDPQRSPVEAVAGKDVCGRDPEICVILVTVVVS